MKYKTENFILVSCIAVCCFIRNPHTADTTLTIRHTMFHICTFLLCTCILFRKKKNISAVYLTLVTIFALYCAATMLSGIGVVNMAEYLYSMLTTLIVFIFVVHVSIVANKKIITKALMYVALVLACYGFYEIIKIGLPGIKSVVGLGFTNGRNLWSNTLLLLMPFVMYQALNRSKVAMLTLTILVLDLIMLQTRSAYAGILVASVFTLWHYNKKIIIPILITFAVSMCFIDRLNDSRTLQYRFQSWGRSIKVICDEPILGVGAGNWKIAVPKYGNGFHAGDKEKTAFHQRAHNDFIEVMTEIGIVGGLVYAGFFVIAVMYTFKMHDKTLALCMRFGIISYMTLAFFTFPKERALHTMLIYTIIALVMHDYKKKNIWLCKKHCKIFILCISMIVTAIFINVKRSQAETYCIKVMQHKSVGNWNQVINIIDSNYSPFANMVSYAVTPILQYRAEANLKLGRHINALHDYLNAEKVHPNHPIILANIGYYKMIQNKQQEAYAYYKRANSIFPSVVQIPERCVVK